MKHSAAPNNTTNTTKRNQMSDPAGTVSRPERSRGACSFAAARFLLACTLSAGALFAVNLTPAAAQDRGPVQRTVQGKVTSKAGAILKGSVVYLKNDHTLAIKSFIADDDGAFRFGQLSSNTDYELWAESNGKKSPTKTISSFDSKNSFNIDLKVDTGS